MKNITTTSLIGNISITGWTGKKLSETGTRELVEKHNSDRSYVRAQKTVISEDILKQPVKIASVIRNYIYANSLPWGDNGDRIFPSSKIGTIQQEIARLTAEYKEKGQYIADNIARFKEEARQRLNGLFEESDYPTPEEIISKFSVRAVFFGVPEADGIRAEMNEEQRKYLIQCAQDEIKHRTKNAVADLVDRVKRLVTHARDTLKEYKEGSRLHESLIGNIRDIVAVIPDLNITDDPKIGALVDQLSPLCQISIDGLKKSSEYRDSTAQKAQAIAEAMNDIF